MQVRGGGLPSQFPSPCVGIQDCDWDLQRVAASGSFGHGGVHAPAIIFWCDVFWVMLAKLFASELLIFCAPILTRGRGAFGYVSGGITFGFPEGRRQLYEGARGL